MHNRFFCVRVYYLFVNDSDTYILIVSIINKNDNRKRKNRGFVLCVVVVKFISIDEEEFIS